MTRRKILVFLLLVLTSLAGVGWWQRGRIGAWWQVRNLACAEDAALVAQSFVALGEDAIAPLLDGLRAEDETTCRNLDFGLRSAVSGWRADDPRILRTMEAVQAAFPGLSLEGKKSVLRFAASCVSKEDDQPLPGQVARVLGDLMAAAEPNDPLRPMALSLAGALVERAPSGQWQASCRALASKGLTDANVATRLAAIQLVLREPLRNDVELLTRVVPFLNDRDTGLRRAALVALGTNNDVVREEHLLPLLHDADLDIQRLCEAVLRSRGLGDNHVRLARFVSDPSPAVRLQVIPLLRHATDLDVDVWLRRLTLDPAPAVRAAAVRAAGNQPSDDIRQRLGEMAQADPSPTVREIARFYVDHTTVRKVGK